MKVAFALLATCTILCAAALAAPPTPTTGSSATANLKPNKISQKTSNALILGVGVNSKSEALSPTKTRSQDRKLMAPVSAPSKVIKGGSEMKLRVNKIDPGSKIMLDGLSVSKMKTSSQAMKSAPPQLLRSDPK